MPWGAVAGAAIVAGGSYLASQSASDAAEEQANALREQGNIEYARAQEAAGRVPEFKPVAVTSTFGTPKYTYDESGRLVGVSSQPAAWLQSLQEKGQGVAGRYFDTQAGALAAEPTYRAASQKAFGAGGTVYDLAQQAAAQQAGLYDIGQEMYGLGRGLAGTAQQFGTTGQALQGTGADIYAKAAQALPTSYDTTQATQDYYNRMQQLVAPQREQELAKTRQSLFNTGRTGLATGATQAGGMLATNPEMAAYYNAVAQQDLQLANQAEQQALSNLAQRTSIGQGLYGTGLQQYQAGLGAQQQGVGTTQAMAGILGQGIGATQAGLGAGTTSAGLYTTGTGLFGLGGSLENQYYTNLVAAQAPYTQSMAQLSSLESMANQPVTQGMSYGANVTNQANAIADAYLRASGAGSASQIAAINAQAQADAYNPWASALMGAGQAIGGTNWSGLLSSGGGGGASQPSYNQAVSNYGSGNQMFSNVAPSGFSYGGFNTSGRLY